MSGQHPQLPTLKKAQSVRYSESQVAELMRLLGAYAYYMTNRQTVRAFFNMDSIILHVEGDLVPDRIFKSYSTDTATKVIQNSGDIHHPVTWVQLLLDGNIRKMLFLRYSALFRSLFGNGPSLDGKFSWSDLRPRSKPKAEEDCVWINTHAKFIDVWGHYDYDYLTNKIRFVTVQNSINAAGFPIQNEKPLFSFTDKNIHKKMTNAVPFVYWSQNDRIVTAQLKEVSKRLEMIVAFPLLAEGFRIVKSGLAPGVAGQGAPAAVDQGDSEQGVVQPYAGMDYLPGFDDEEGSEEEDEE